MKQDNRAYFDGELMRETLKCFARSGTSMEFAHGLIYGMGHMFMIKGGEYASICEIIARHLPRKCNMELLHPVFCASISDAIDRVMADRKNRQEKRQANRQA